MRDSNQIVCNATTDEAQLCEAMSALKLAHTNNDGIYVGDLVKGEKQGSGMFLSSADDESDRLQYETDWEGDYSGGTAALRGKMAPSTRTTSKPVLLQNIAS